MLRISQDHIEAVRAAETGQDLHDPIKRAIELEHSTLPPYLTALYSLDPAKNKAVAALLRSIVRDEMLHMAIMCNLLNALDGEPALTDPGFIPNYPGPLPMNIGKGLVVGLEPFSIPLVRDVFMTIEEPESPLVFPDRPHTFALELLEDFATIGEFYKSLIKKLQDLGGAAFTGDQNKQVVDNNWFGADRLFPIKSLNEAVSAIHIIVQEGEGTTTKPLAGIAGNGVLAHYYRFAEIVHGFELIATDANHYAYGGAPLVVDPSGIYPFRKNMTLADLPKGSRAAAVGERFASSYTHLLSALQHTFTVDPTFLHTAVGTMFELRLAALDCATTPFSATEAVGLAYQYVPAMA